MGILIDTEKVDDNPRCKNVKVSIIYINIIGASISLFLLLFASFRMYLAKKKLSFLTLIILLIFSSEIINTISKLLQLVKYSFNDRRNHKDFTDGNTPRGIICQIQIVTAIYSDFCSLLGTLLLSLRCYDVIKNKNRFFDTGNNGYLSLIFTILISIILAISFFLIDKLLFTKQDIANRYDVRDRCSYWCWVDHVPSLILFGLYLILLIFNIIFACKTYSYLNKGYLQLLEDSDISYKNKKSMNTPLNELNKENNTQNDTNERKFSILTKEEKTRIEELKLMKWKCIIYPLVTIFIWTCFSIYRIVDDSLMMSIDKGDNPKETSNKEIDKFENNVSLHICVQIFLVVHTFLSATRGIFYGFSFVIFEEKLFFNFFRNCFKNSNNDVEESEDEKKSIIRNTNNSSTIINGNIKEDDNNNENQVDDSNNKDVELNNSDYHCVD